MRQNAKQLSNAHAARCRPVANAATTDVVASIGVSQPRPKPRSSDGEHAFYLFLRVANVKTKRKTARLTLFRSEWRSGVAIEERTAVRKRLREAYIKNAPTYETVCYC